MFSCKGRSLFILRQYDRAIEVLRRGIATTPEYFQPYYFAIAALALSGATPQAKDILKDYLSFGAARIRTVRQFKTVWGALSSYSGWTEAMNRAAKGLREAGMPEQ
jgi:tetratricopeptide (TPR) repeat protein